MKKAVIFLSIFFLTLIIGYLSVPTWTKKVELSEVVPLVEKELPIIQRAQPQSVQIEESVEYDQESEKNYQAKLLETRDFHTQDLTGKSGETWLGLFEQGKTFNLISTKITIKKISNPDLFDKEVFTTKKGKTVFLIKNAKGLTEGEVQTIYRQNDEDYDETASLKNGSQRNFEFNGENYNLRVENNISNEEYPSKGSKLILSSNGKRQVLTDLKKGCNDCSWSIYWVGDLDKDGKLDFYLDLSDHYNVIDKVLFLSSKAEQDKLVKAVANLSTVGC